MSINQRIQEIIDTLFSGNKRAFSRAVKVSSTVTENIVGKRQSRPSFDVTSKIVHSIENINSEWLLTGEGEMLKKRASENAGNTQNVSEGQAQYRNGTYGTEKPFIDSSNKIITTPDSFSVTMKSDECKKIIIPFFSDYDFSIRANGDSMVNSKNPQRSINDQDIVICKLWKSHSHIRWGETYVLVTTEGYTIKKIIQSETEENIKCVSFNKDKGFESYDLPISEILDWAIVVGVVSITSW